MEAARRGTMSTHSIQPAEEAMHSIAEPDHANKSANAESPLIQLPSEDLKKYGLLSPSALDKLVEQDTNSHSLVEGLIRSRSVSVLIGDSGLGKSPLGYQLGLCVAAGVPFLGLNAQQGLVVYADHENGAKDGRALRDSIAGFLGLPAIPDNFICWYETGGAFDLQGVCRDFRPKLLVVDSLRSFDPSFEKTENAGQAMVNLRHAAYKYGVSILGIHHIKKPGPLGPPALDDAVLMHWLNEAAGHRSIINQSDTRIAAALSKRHEDAAMVLRFHRRVRGETGPIYVARVLDACGEPIGYRPMVGPELLCNSEQEEAFRRLPMGEFTFKQAKETYGRSDDPTSKWLKKCIAVGIVKRLGQGRYQKT
jgi:hypothetical protein